MKTFFMALFCLFCLVNISQSFENCEVVSYGDYYNDEENLIFHIMSIPNIANSCKGIELIYADVIFVSLDNCIFNPPITIHLNTHNDKTHYFVEYILPLDVLTENNLYGSELTFKFIYKDIYNNVITIDNQKLIFE